MEKVTSREQEVPRLKTIAIVGPESTGKSILSSQLAAHYNTVWVPEVARSYLDNINRPYHQDDLLAISKLQIEEEEKSKGLANKLLICDTNLLVLKIWMEHAYQTCHPWIIETMQSRHYDLYLLTDIDIPWEPDPQREHPHLREYLFELYHDKLLKMQVPFRIVSGENNTRVANAVKHINSFFYVWESE